MRHKALAAWQSLVFVPRHSRAYLHARIAHKPQAANYFQWFAVEGKGASRLIRCV